MEVYFLEMEFSVNVSLCSFGVKITVINHAS